MHLPSRVAPMAARFNIQSTSRSLTLALLRTAFQTSARSSAISAAQPNELAPLNPKRSTRSKKAPSKEPAAITSAGTDASTGSGSAMASRLYTTSSHKPEAALADSSDRSSASRASDAAAVGTKGASSGVLLLVDGHSVSHRCYWAMSRSKAGGLRTSTGVPTSVTTGVLKTLLNVMSASKPTAMAVVFDEGRSFRYLLSVLLGALKQAGMNTEDYVILCKKLTSILKDGRKAVSPQALQHLETAQGQKQLEVLLTSVLGLPRDRSGSCGEQVMEAGQDQGLQPVSRDVLTGWQERVPPAVRYMLSEAFAAFPVSDEVMDSCKDKGSEYKANRQPTPEDFNVDLANLKRVLSSMQLGMHSEGLLEGDDVLAGLSQLGVDGGYQVIILTGDKDMLQLVDDERNVQVWYLDGNFGKSGRSTAWSIMDEAGVLEKMGVEPRQVADFKAFMGDSSDNLSGVKGIGPKTATKLLLELGPSLSDVFNNLDKIPAKRQKEKDKLASGEADAYYAQFMVTLGSKMMDEIKLELDSFKLRGFQHSRVKAILSELEIQTFNADLQKLQDLLGGEVTQTGSDGPCVMEIPSRIDAIQEKRGMLDDERRELDVKIAALEKEEAELLSKLHIGSNLQPGAVADVQAVTHASLEAELDGVSTASLPQTPEWGFVQKVYVAECSTAGELQAAIQRYRSSTTNPTGATASSHTGYANTWSGTTISACTPHVNTEWPTTTSSHAANANTGSPTTHVLPPLMLLGHYHRRGDDPVLQLPSAVTLCWLEEQGKQCSAGQDEQYGEEQGKQCSAGQDEQYEHGASERLEEDVVPMICVVYSPIPEGAEVEFMIESQLAWMLEDPAVPKVVHGAKTWHKLMHSMQPSKHVNGIIMDTLMGAYVLDPSLALAPPGGPRRGKPADSAASLDPGLDPASCLEAVATAVGVARDMPASTHLLVWQPWPQPSDEAAQQLSPTGLQAASSSLLLHKLYSSLQKQYESVARKSLQLLTDTELPLQAALADMELLGVRIDTDILDKLKVDVEESLQRVESAISEMLPADQPAINLASPKQLSVLLFETLQLPTKGAKKRSTGGYSTDAQALKHLEKKHAVVPLILEHRKLSTMKSSFVEQLRGLVCGEEERLHTQFNQAGTLTGRLSTSRPNLQSIPTKQSHGALATTLRSAFVPTPGWHFLSADYSQMELRILAQLSKDPALMAAFQAGEDVHVLTARKLFNIDNRSEVTVEQRSVAKTINFGVIYGQGASALKEGAGLRSIKEAQGFINSFYASYPCVKACMEAACIQAVTKGYVETMFGRRRHFLFGSPALTQLLGSDMADMSNGRLPPQVQDLLKNSSSAAKDSHLLRAASNAPIQGTGADILKRAMVAVSEQLAASGLSSRLVLSIHDSIIVEVAPGELGQVRQLLVSCMEAAGGEDFVVPLKVDLQEGTSWADL